jgi:hypothetical protein
MADAELFGELCEAASSLSLPFRRLRSATRASQGNKLIRVVPGANPADL